MDAQKALSDAAGELDRAVRLVRERGLTKAEKKTSRQTKEGYVAAYTHATGKVAALVEILCETDFVARNDQFRNLARDLAMQVAAMNPRTVDELLSQEFIKDSNLTIDQLVKSLSGQVGEKLVINRLSRLSVGE